MARNIARRAQRQVLAALARKPAVQLTGPRQVGKTTLARDVIGQILPSTYLDLQLPEVRKDVTDNGMLDGLGGRLVILDEIQLLPDLVDRLRPVIRSRKREGMRTGQFLLLGSDTTELSCAGMTTRAIGYIDALEAVGFDIDRLWSRGGLPDSFLARNEAASRRWRNAYINRLPPIPASSLGQLPIKCGLGDLLRAAARHHGKHLELHALSTNLQIQPEATQRGIATLEDMGLVRYLDAFSLANGPTLMTRPKFYVRDSGLFLAAMGCTLTPNSGNLASTVTGLSWEGFVIENVLSVLPAGWRATYYRSHAGEEIDLVLEHPGGAIWAIEIKSGATTRLSTSVHAAMSALQPARKYIVNRGEQSLALANGLQVVQLPRLLQDLLDVNHDARARTTKMRA